MRRLVGSVAAALAVLATAACSGGGGDPHSSTPSSPTVTRTVTETSSAPSPTPTISPDEQLPESRHLAETLMTAPAGSRQWYNSGDWPQQVQPTLRQYVTRFYDSSTVSQHIQEFAQNGVDGIAHRTWIMPSNAQEDDVLVRFADTAGASSCFGTDTEVPPGGADYTTFEMSGLPSGAEVVAYRTSTPDSKGFIRVKVAAQRGPVVAFMFMWFPQKYDTATAQTWAAAQITRMPI